MTKLVFAVHEIHDKNGVHLNEVFEPVADDLDTLKAVGAVREPTEQELAFHKLTKGKDAVEAEVAVKEDEATKAAAKPAAKATTKPASKTDSDDEIK